ncbi:hypothetical protein HRbin01_00592 [archaeon HR01]|nr:hypothetical protein HRbin01_00592 [archaeon HR01]
MNYWIFVVKDHLEAGRKIPVEEILDIRARERFWLLSSRAARTRNMEEGDEVIFYTTGERGRFFAGRARLHSKPKPITDSIRFYIRGSPSEALTHYVELDSVELWKNPLNAEEVAPSLSFIKKKEKWPMAFRGSIRRISEEDYNRILERAVQA